MEAPGMADGYARPGDHHHGSIVDRVAASGIALARVGGVPLGMTTDATGMSYSIGVYGKST